MIRLLRIGLSWVLYDLGDLTCTITDGRAYSLYNWLMHASDRVQGELKSGPWRWYGDEE